MNIFLIFVYLFQVNTHAPIHTSNPRSLNQCYTQQLNPLNSDCFYKKMVPHHLSSSGSLHPAYRVAELDATLLMEVGSMQKINLIKLYYPWFNSLLIIVFFSIKKKWVKACLCNVVKYNLSFIFHKNGSWYRGSELHFPFLKIKTLLEIKGHLRMEMLHQTRRHWLEKKKWRMFFKNAVHKCTIKFQWT